MEENYIKLLLQQQNNLLEQTNRLLENHNSLLKKVLNDSRSESSEQFVENLSRDEMRSGFLVTSDRKKLWNVQIGILKEFARVCEKHNLKWFAWGGTLLGAIRHRGFIPWDDDMDVGLLRPDYEKFRQIISEEVRSPYFFVPWYNYRLESDEVNGIIDEAHFPRIPLDLQGRGPTWCPFWPILRLKDSRTTFIVRQGQKAIQQSVYIDIFPFDPVPPFKNEHQDTVFKASSLLFLATIMPWVVKKNISQGHKLVISHKELEKFMQLPFRKRALRWENFNADNFSNSKYVSQVRDLVVIMNPKLIVDVKSFDNMISAKFEKIKVPIPTGYDDILTACYGDWHKPKIFPSPATEYSADIPYREYADKSGFMNT